jgi:hypothetical protein
MRGDYIRRGIGLTTGFIGSHTVTITVYMLYNSQQLSFFSCSEDPGSNCCNQLLWRPLPLLTNCLTGSVAERTTKRTPPKVPLLLHGLPIVACLFVPCLATVVNKRLHC